jgi:predicted RNA binding protein YcfA (HicA-like mRNA interferase family)
MKYAVITNRDFEKILKANGYTIVRTSGGHSIWYNDDKKDSITISSKLNPMVARRLIKEHDLKGE